LADHPLCEVCSTDDRPVVATEVDHKVALINGGADFDEDPCQAQALCKRCHKDKTDRDLGHKPRLAIGADGWPTDESVSFPQRTKVGR
jgi:5-methylcytosine-specific restriction protein A